MNRLEHPQGQSIRRIGICDSGIGGLSILHALVPLGIEEYIYIGDTQHVPYGNKSVSEIQRLSIKLIQFLIDQKVDAIVIACHTICSTSLDILEKTFPHISFFEIIDGTVQQAISYTRNNTIGVIGTTATIASGIYTKKITARAPEIRVIEKACPDLASLIEQHPWDLEEIDYALKRYLSPLLVRSIDTLIIACTHYILIQDMIKHLTPQALLVNAQQPTRRVVHLTLPEDFRPVSVPRVTIYVTGDDLQFTNPYESVITNMHTKQIQL